MGCCGHFKELREIRRAGTSVPDRQETIAPSEACIFCAEKHLSTAWRLATERGYGGINRLAIIGELVLAQWHIFETDEALAKSIRAMRHIVQQRRKEKIIWDAPLRRMNELAAAEAEKIGKEKSHEQS